MRKIQIECKQMDYECIMETGYGALLTPEEEGKKNELIHKLSKINVKIGKTDDEIINLEKDEGHETPSKRQESSRDNEDWSPTAISSLLDAWCHCYKNATKSSKLDMDCVWKEISAEVSKRCKSSKKPKDLDQCKSRLKSMQGRYNREKLAKKFNPNECSSWEWYDTMNSLFIENPHFMLNSMDAKNSQQGICIKNDVLSSRTPYDISDEQVRKCIIDQITLRKSRSNDESRKILDINKEENLNSKFYLDEKNVQHSNLPTPTSPKSPRSFMKVKWRDSTPPQVNLLDKLIEDQTCQDSLLNANLLDFQDGKKSFLLVNESKEKLLNCEQGTSTNVSILDRKGKGTLKTFDSCSGNSTSCFGSDMTDEDSATTSPIVLKASQTKRISNKHDADIGSSDKDVEDQHIGGFRVMELSRSINCNYKCTCVENITNTKRANENKEVFKEIVSKIDEPKSHIIEKMRAQDQNLATNIVRNDEQMDVSIARTNLEAHSTKMISKGSSLASLTSQSESSYSSKHKRKLCISSKYKHERGNQSSRTLITALMRANNMPQFKRRVRSLNRASLVHEPNMVTALMTFGAMIQQLEKNHIVLMERILNEQSNILKDFVKTLKYNHQVREVNFIYFFK